VSYIKFPSVIKEWFLDVGLNDIGTIGTIVVFLFSFDDGFDLLESFAYLYAVTSIGELSRFDNPDILF
jgi:hypothetical protein